MKVNTFTYNTLPRAGDSFWQIVLFPTCSILSSVDEYDPYTAVNFEWLYWSLSLTFRHDKTR